MGFTFALLALNLAAGVIAHGFVKTILVDNKLYPGWSGATDTRLKAKRIAFSNKQSSGGRFAVTEQLTPDITCNKDAKTPALIANARAGSNITFQWSPWLVSHKGPLITYMAPYDGDIEKVNLQSLKFFKIHERGLLPDNKTWATDEMGYKGNSTSVTIPHDIKAGKYIVRHELIAMHFATEDSVWTRAGPDFGPQHYIQCFNLDISGTGGTVPQGTPFPGTYKHFTQEPGLYFDIYWGVTPYPLPGGPVYTPSTQAPFLATLPYEIVSPMGDPEADRSYNIQMAKEYASNDAGTRNLNKERPKHGPLSNFTGPAGIVNSNQKILGTEYWFGDGYMGDCKYCGLH